METMPVEAIAPPPTVSPANVAPHLPPPTEIPLPGPAEPIQLAEKPSHAVSGGSSEEKELEAMVDEISAALTSLGMNEGERNPQAGKGQLTLKDMKAAVWLPRLPKKRELEGTPNVAVLDTHGVLRPVANPHSKPAAPPFLMSHLKIVAYRLRIGVNINTYYIYGFPKMGLHPIIQNIETHGFGVPPF